MIAMLLASMLLVGEVDCAPPPGLELVWRDDRTRFLVVGETHGTAEAPAAFAEMTCAASENGPVVAALELPELMQPQLEAMMAAPDDATAKAALEGTWFLNPRIDDGRTSVAMRAMLYRLRSLRQAGRDVTIHAFVPSLRRAPGLGQAYSEIHMAARLSDAARNRPDARILVLVGKAHASKQAVEGGRIGLPAVGHLPPEEVVSLVIAPQGGEAWNCRPDCGVHVMEAIDDPTTRGVSLTAVEDGAYDGKLRLGPTTASRPVMQPQQP